MYSRSSFGSYYPVDSLIHRLNPIIKLVNFVITFILILLNDSVYITIFLLVFLLVMMLMSLVPIKYYFNTFYSLRYIYLLVAFICAFFGKNILEYFVYVSKIIVFFEYLNILAFTTSPSESIYSIDRFLSLFNFLYLNTSLIAYKINNVLRYFPLYMSVKYKTITSSISRGIIYNRLNIIRKIKLHFNIRRLTKVKSKEILNASTLRLFDTKVRRSNYRTNKLSFNDIFFLLFHLVLFYAYLIEGGLI